MRDRERELERLCQAALERPVSERAGVLAEACGGDEGLRREAESLLAREGAAASFLLSDRASHVSGVILPVDGGFVA